MSNIASAVEEQTATMAVDARSREVREESERMGALVSRFRFTTPGLE